MTLGSTFVEYDPVTGWWFYGRDTPSSTIYFGCQCCESGSGTGTGTGDDSGGSGGENCCGCSSACDTVTIDIDITPAGGDYSGPCPHDPSGSGSGSGSGCGESGTCTGENSAVGFEQSECCNTSVWPYGPNLCSPTGYCCPPCVGGWATTGIPWPTTLAAAAQRFGQIRPGGVCEYGGGYEQCDLHDICVTVTPPSTTEDWTVQLFESFGAVFHCGGECPTFEWFVARKVCPCDPASWEGHGAFGSQYYNESCFALGRRYCVGIGGVGTVTGNCADGWEVCGQLLYYQLYVPTPCVIGTFRARINCGGTFSGSGVSECCSGSASCPDGTTYDPDTGTCISGGIEAPPPVFGTARRPRSRPAPRVPAAPVPLRTIPPAPQEVTGADGRCRHLGELVRPCTQGPGMAHHRCRLGKGDERGQARNDRECNTCPHYLEAIPPACPEDGDKPAGVVVGTYGWPRLAELQIRLLRHHNPGVPILIADDGSPAAAELEALEAKYDDVTVWVSPERRGHYAGDLSAFWKGCHWARTRGFRWLAKVSQRLLIDRPDWVRDSCRLLASAGAAVASGPCLDNGKDLKLRTELCILDVPLWSADDVLPVLDQHNLGNAAEFYVWGRVHDRFGGALARLPWLTENRYHRSEGTVWHGSHTLAELAALAAAHGMAVDEQMSMTGWQHLPDWKRG